jgi:geranylgeranyl pyrophosphate synthase
MPRKIGKIVVADLKKRSEKGLSLAKQMLLAEKMGYPKLREALEHYIANWNDSTHPGLFAMACEAVGGDIKDALQAQAAIAIMAAAFDIHDDIIDESETKHKVPTVYGKFGTGIAILLGNAFLIEGFKLLVDSAAVLPKERGKSMLEAYKKLLFEVGNAHALEVGLKGRKNVAPSDYLKIIEMKAAGIEADVYLGALFGGGNDIEVEASARLGRILGILVTLREEFIDVFEIEELRQRIAVHDLPLPLLAVMQDKKAAGEVHRILSKYRLSEEDITKLLNVTLEAEPVLEIKEKMQLLMGEGIHLAKKLPNSKPQGKLQAFISFMLEDL